MKSFGESRRCTSQFGQRVFAHYVFDRSHESSCSLGTRSHFRKVHTHTRPQKLPFRWFEFAGNSSLRKTVKTLLSTIFNNFGRFLLFSSVLSTDPVSYFPWKQAKNRRAHGLNSKSPYDSKGQRKHALICFSYAHLLTSSTPTIYRSIGCPRLMSQGQSLRRFRSRLA